MDHQTIACGQKVQIRQKETVRVINYVCTERIFDSRPSMYDKIFLKINLEACSPHIHASFGTFCIQIGQLFAAQ